GRRTHVHAATALAEVHWHTDDANLFWHLGSARVPFGVRGGGTGTPPKNSSAARHGSPRKIGSLCVSAGPASLPRIDTIDHAREGDDFPDVLSSTNPRDGPLEAQPEARVRHTAVASQVQVPLKGLLGQVVLAESLDQQIVVGDPFAAADDLTVAF